MDQQVLSDRGTRREVAVAVGPYRLGTFQVTQDRYAEVTGLTG
jgi:hypothetical protein